MVQVLLDVLLLIIIVILCICVIFVLKQVIKYLTNTDNFAKVVCECFSCPDENVILINKIVLACYYHKAKKNLYLYKIWVICLVYDAFSINRIQCVCAISMQNVSKRLLV